MKRKNNYEQPETLVTRVELESPICSGSAKLTNEGNEGIAIQDQAINEEFDNYNPTHSNSSNGGWDTIE